MPAILHTILDTGYWMLDAGCWILDTGYWILDTGYWILDTGYWILQFAGVSNLPVPVGLSMTRLLLVNGNHPVSSI